MQKHALLTVVGLVLAAAAVAWVQPNTNGGTTFIVVIIVMFVNAVGVVAIRSRSKHNPAPKVPASRPTARAKVAKE